MHKAAECCFGEIHSMPTPATEILADSVQSHTFHVGLWNTSIAFPQIYFLKNIIIITHLKLFKIAHFKRNEEIKKIF